MVANCERSERTRFNPTDPPAIRRMAVRLVDLPELDLTAAYDTRMINPGL
jgi:hypothetical protein